VSRLLHVSDIHFGPKHVAEPARGLRTLVESERPDVVVVSGDLTQRAKPAQFREARAYLDSLAAPVVFVPGNHDVPLFRFWERLFAPFGAWRRHFHPELVRDYLGDELAIVGINSAHAWTTKHGRIRKADLVELEQRLSRLPAGRIRVLVTHHPVAGAPELGREPVARRSGRLLALARRHDVRLVLCGHLHHGFSVALDGEGGAPGPLVLHTGTTTSSRGRGREHGRNSLNWIEIGADRVRVEPRTWDPARGRFETVEPGGGAAR